MQHAARLLWHPIVCEQRHRHTVGVEGDLLDHILLFLKRVREAGEEERVRVRRKREMSEDERGSGTEGERGTLLGPAQDSTASTIRRHTHVPSVNTQPLRSSPQ